MRMVIINKCPWAIGLQWTPPHLKRLSRHELVHMARELDHDFSIVTKRKQQAGFGNTNNTDDWKKVRSLAAFLPECTSFLGIFALRDVQGEQCWWVFARLHGINLGTGDQVFVSQEEANTEANVLRDLQKSTFAESVTCETEEESVAWLSSRCGLQAWHYVFGSALLTPLHDTSAQNRTLSMMLLGIPFVLLSIWGVHAFFEYRAEKELLEASQRRLAAQEAYKQQILANPDAYFTQEWQNVSLANVQGQACLNAIQGLPIMMSGWALQSASCSGRTLTASWAHKTGSDYLALSPKAKLTSPTAAQTKTTFTAVLSKREKQPYTSLKDKDYITRFLYQLCTVTSSKVRLRFAPPQTTTIDEVSISAPWSKGTWEISALKAVAVQSGELTQILSQIPGLTLDSIEWKRAGYSDIWTFKGRVFVSVK